MREVNVSKMRPMLSVDQVCVVKGRSRLFSPTFYNESIKTGNVHSLKNNVLFRACQPCAYSVIFRYLEFSANISALTSVSVKFDLAKGYCNFRTACISL